MSQHHYYLPNKSYYKYNSHLPVLTSRTSPGRQKKGETLNFYNILHKLHIQNLDKEGLYWAIKMTLTRQIINLVSSIISMRTSSTCCRGCRTMLRSERDRKLMTDKWDGVKSSCSSLLIRCIQISRKTYKP